jgi:hypothetical protein
MLALGTAELKDWATAVSEGWRLEDSPAGHLEVEVVGLSGGFETPGADASSQDGDSKSGELWLSACGAYGFFSSNAQRSHGIP